MKTSSLNIVVGTYTEKNLFHLFKKMHDLGIRLGPGKDILNDMVEWPENKFPRRSEIFPFASNTPTKCARIANLFELCAFILHQPSFVVRNGEIEAYDDALENFYKATDIDLTVPVFGLHNDQVMLYLRSRRKPPVEYKLAAND